MKKIAVYCTLFLLGGCTNYLYQGEITAQDSAGMKREVILYWSKTDPLLGREKAGPIVVLTQCGSSIIFDERDEGIVFRGEAGREVIARTGEPVVDGFICGKVLNQNRFVDLGEGNLELTILCKPVSDKFSVKPRHYILAADEPYRFEVNAKKKWSFLGKVPPAPIADCL